MDWIMLTVLILIIGGALSGISTAASSRLSRMEEKEREASNHCIMCGAEIPEGLMVCPDCERKVMGRE